jgi:hypothetical protein
MTDINTKVPSSQEPITDENKLVTRVWYTYFDNLVRTVSGWVEGLTGLTSNGIVVRTGADEYDTRTITAGNGIDITNGDGVSGNPVITFTGATTGSALTKVDDTNVTLTLGGSPTTAVVNPVSLTLGWSGQLSLSRGGTNASLTASNGGIVYSTASALAVLSGTATAGRILQSGASTTPSWSTPTYPSAAGTAGKILRSDGTNNVYSTATFADTYTASNILYSNGSNTVTGLATANNGVLITSGAGVPSISSTLPTAVQTSITQLGTITSGVWNGSNIPTQYGGTGADLSGSSAGQIPIFNVGGFVSAFLTAGNGITVTSGAGSVTVSSTGAGVDYVAYT